MFRKMRRGKQQLSHEESIEVLRHCTNGVLSVTGDDGYPYGVPLSYVYHDNHIYFHCAKEGHKLDALRQNNKVCFTVVDADEVHAEELTTYFRSVIAFGKARILDSQEAMNNPHIVLSEKYCSSCPEIWKKAMETELHRMVMVDIEIEHLTGKQARELIQK